MPEQATLPIDRVYGLVLGGALGDALGGPHEFRRSTAIYTSRLESPTIWFNRFQNKNYLSELGQVTDDTEMARCLINSLVETRGQYNPERTVKHYQDWANHKTTFFMGRNTRALLKGVSTHRGYRSRFQKQFPNESSQENAQSNGALMRSGPLAILGISNSAISWSDLSLVIQTDCFLTNPSRTAGQVNLIFIHTVLDALKGLNKDQIKSNLLQYMSTFTNLCPNIVAAVEQAFDGPPRNVRENKGWCVHGLYSAIRALFQEDDYQSAINWTIQAGGDTDTNACIAGYLLGAYYGLDQMKNNPITKNNLEILMKCTTEDGDIPRPKYYWTGGLLPQIDRLLKY